MFVGIIFLNDDKFTTVLNHSVYFGTTSLNFPGPKIWDLVPLDLKQLERLCRTYIQQVESFLKAVKLIMIICLGLILIDLFPDKCF